jgi:hypothetical protein
MNVLERIADLKRRATEQKGRQAGLDEVRRLQLFLAGASLLSKGLGIEVAQLHLLRGQQGIILPADVAGAEAGVDDRLEILLVERLHTKGILTATGLLSGSMNLTYSGVELNDECVVFDTCPEAVAKARLAFRQYRAGATDER